MPRECLETVKAFYFPQLDGPVPTRTRELTAIGREGQSCHPLSMSRMCPRVYAGLCLLWFPHPNASIGVSTDEQSPIRTPSQRVRRATLTSQLLHVRAALGIPQLDEGITPTASEQVPIRSKGHVYDASRLLTPPEQSAADDIPQLDRTSP